MRRLITAAVACLFAVVIIGTATWILWVPNYRPSLQPGQQFGIDVSAHQGNIDWNAVARDNIHFAYVKATEGMDFFDPKFIDNWNRSRHAGLKHGAYHFFTLCTPGQPQADNFLSHVPHDADALAPAIDLELGGNCKDRPAAAAVRKQLETFVDAVERATGKTMVFYVGGDFEKLYPTQTWMDRPDWRRRIFRHPATNDWAIWQFSGLAHVNGISERVDLNIAKPN